MLRRPCGGRTPSLRRCCCLGVVLSTSWLLACGRPRPGTEVETTSGTEPPTPARSVPAAGPGGAGSADRCLARIEETLARESLPAATKFGRNRTAIFLRAKAEPAWFVRAPEDRTSDDPSVRSMQRSVARTAYPWERLGALMPALRARPDLARALLLREGYLWAETPEMAHAIYDRITAELLFSERRIWIQRGALTSWAERDSSGRYLHGDGSPARVLPLDRIGVGSPPSEALHRDLRALRLELGFDRARILHATADTLVADLRYGRAWVPTLLAARGAALRLECEAVSPERETAVRVHRTEVRRRSAAFERVRGEVLAQIDESLPFDEPVTEVGQQDGILRRAWWHAYRTGRSSYLVNGDRYAVFDATGRPLVPQLCVDFLRDSIERAAGTWFRRRDEARERVVGRFDFEPQGGDALRGVWTFVELARSRADWMETTELPDHERIPFGRVNRVLSYLVDRADEFVEGDMVFVFGRVPWDPIEPHYHSFFVWESDPATGMPIVLAGNAGRPALRPWMVELLRTPERSIRFRLRPRLEWLESVVGVHAPPGAPAPLVAGAG